MNGSYSFTLLAAIAVLGLGCSSSDSSDSQAVGNQDGGAGSGGAAGQGGSGGSAGQGGSSGTGGAAGSAGTGGAAGSAGTGGAAGSAGTGGAAGSAGDYLTGDQFEPWEGGPAYYGKWTNGPSTDPNFFPIAVWLQDPQNTTSAQKYKEIGVNTHVGLYNGPTEAQLAAMASIPSVGLAAQNSVALASKNIGVLKGWTHDDEPDNALNGTEDPVPTADVIAKYQTMVKADSTGGYPPWTGMFSRGVGYLPFVGMFNAVEEGVKAI